MDIPQYLNQVSQKYHGGNATDEKELNDFMAKAINANIIKFDTTGTEYIRFLSALIEYEED